MPPCAVAPARGCPPPIPLQGDTVSLKCVEQKAPSVRELSAKLTEGETVPLAAATFFVSPPPAPAGAPSQRGPSTLQSIEEFWPRRSQSGQREKSVKKNAALLHFLGFFPLTHLFGVLRGE